LIATTVFRGTAAQPAATGWGARLRELTRRPSGTGLRLSGVALLVLVWWLCSATGILDPTTLAGPGAVVTKGAELIRDGELPANLWISLHRVLLGLVTGVSAGVVLALGAGLSKLTEAVVDGPMQIFRSLPILALQPLFVLWFGIGEEMKVVIIAVAVAFPVYINTYAGIRGIDRRFVELAHGVRLSTWQFARKVVLPGSLPEFFVGLRLAFTVSWLVLILSEQINATSGIGYMINQAGMTGQTNVIVVGLAVYGLLGLLSDLIVRLLERSVLSWRRGLEAS
jgi:sulfonate transport system permease protein